MVSEDEIARWYDQRHLSRKEQAWRPFSAYSVFLDYLRVNAGRKLLDVGCGTGFLLKHADSRGLDTYGVDISQEGVKIARRVSPDSSIRVGKGESLPFPDSYFDYVTCIGALEHFLDMDNGISEMVRVAKSGARFCIVVPNIDWIVYKMTGQKGTEQAEINEKLLSLVEWKGIFSKAGFIIDRLCRDKWGKKIMNTYASGKPLIKKIFYKTLWFLLPLKYEYQFVFIMALSRPGAGERC